MNTIHRIKGLVQEGNSVEAIGNLVQFLESHKSELLNSAIIVQASVNDFQKKVIEGTISFEDTSVTFNRINSSILGIVNTYENQNNLEKRVGSLIEKQKRNYAYVYILAFLSLTTSSLAYSLFLEKSRYAEEAARKDVYLQTLEFQKAEILNDVARLKSKIPQMEIFLIEFQRLYQEHLKAVRNNDYILKNMAMNDIRDLPEKHRLTWVLRNKPDSFSHTVLSHSDTDVLKDIQFKTRYFCSLNSRIFEVDSLDTRWVIQSGKE